MFTTISNRHKKNLKSELNFLSERIEIDGLKPEHDVRLAAYYIDSLNFEQGLKKLNKNKSVFPENKVIITAHEHGTFFNIIYDLIHDYYNFPNYKKLKKIAELLNTAEKENLYPRLESELEDKIYCDLIKSKQLMLPKSIIRLTISFQNSDPNFLRHINSVLSVTDFNLKTEADIQKFEEVINFFSNRNSFIELLLIHTVQDLKIEIFLSNLRRTYLQNYEKIKISPQHLKVLNAIASQNFLNEFISSISDEERNKLDDLEKNLSSSVSVDVTNINFKLTIFACYKEFSELRDPTLIQCSPEIKNIYNMHIEQKLIEQSLKEKIPSFLKLKDKTSKAVQLQYESNPYPRWDCIVVPEQKHGLGHWLCSFSKKFTNLEITNVKYPKVLVAGTGTGQQSISTSLVLSGCSVDALDLSKASLSYAMRKANELSVKNINFFQADLFEIDFLKENYDLIQCSGVLHHTSDPLTGLKILKSKLKAHGIIQIGLYSRFARFHLNKIRNEIAKRSLGNSKQEMLNFRKELIERMDSDEAALTITQWCDFFTTSMFRDLCFHEHEVQYDCQDLAKLIDEAGLEFVCMMLPPNKQNEYHSITGKIAADADLKDWHEFEVENTAFFAEMYNFFVKSKS